MQLASTLFCSDQQVVCRWGFRLDSFRVLQGEIDVIRQRTYSCCKLTALAATPF
jgi:hypothetical protein